MIKEYIKKPVKIEAVQWTGNNLEEIVNFVGEENLSRDYKDGKYNIRLPLGIKTLEGKHIASIGDFIIKGIKGEFYPCKPDIFQKTYRKVK